AYLSGRIKQDPYAAKEELLSGRMAQYLGGKDATWLDKAQAEIDRREAEERRRLEHERAVLRADVEADWRDNVVDARINGEVNPAYENRIRLAYADDPEQAEEKISYLHREVDRHKIETKIALAPNDAVE